MQLELFIIPRLLNINMSNIRILSVTENKLHSWFSVIHSLVHRSQSSSGSVTNPRNFPEC